MDKQTQKYLIIGAIVFVVLISVGVWFYRKGKKQTTIQKVPNDNPTGSGPNNPYTVGSPNITQLVQDLHSDMSGLNLFNNDASVYTRLMTLSDTDFVNVYNTFNSKYQIPSGQTLKEWIEGEQQYWGSDFSVIKPTVISRMGRLNLK